MIKYVVGKSQPRNLSKYLIDYLLHAGRTLSL